MCTDSGLHGSEGRTERFRGVNHHRGAEGYAITPYYASGTESNIVQSHNMSYINKQLNDNDLVK